MAGSEEKISGEAGIDTKNDENGSEERTKTKQKRKLKQDVVSK